ncbi:MAG TPA: phosphatase PAP2 family protein, partial [Firmicutes bacterium]|nr:phosphatase PAP2 family protein [Bacillota bacterium]
MEFIRIIQSVHSPFLDSLAKVITMLGEDTFFIVLAVVMIWCVNKKSGWRLGLIALSSGALNAGLKQIFKIERPIGQEGIRSLRLETAGGYSFPSGHSQFTASVWTKLATLINQTWFYVVASIVIVLVGLSRIYLGVHFLSDVLAGLLIGIAWALVFDQILDFLEQKPLYLSLLGVLLVISLPFFPVADYYKV